MAKCALFVALALATVQSVDAEPAVHILTPESALFYPDSEPHEFSAEGGGAWEAIIDFGLEAKQGPSPWIGDVSGDGGAEWFFGQIAFIVDPDSTVPADGPPLEIVASTNEAVFASIHIAHGIQDRLAWETVGFEGASGGQLDDSVVVFRNLLQNSGVAVGDNLLSVHVVWPPGSSGSVTLFPAQSGLVRTFSPPNSVSVSSPGSSMDGACLNLKLQVDRHPGEEINKAILTLVNAEGAVILPDDPILEVEFGPGDLRKETLVCLPLSSEASDESYLVDIETTTEPRSATASSFIVGRLPLQYQSSSGARQVLLPIVFASGAGLLFLWRRRSSARTVVSKTQQSLKDVNDDNEGI